MLNTPSIGLEIIAETGFTCWGDFYCSITSNSISGLPITYEYQYSQKEKRKIDLDIPSHIVEALAVEEGKILLKMIKMNSFAALYARIIAEGKEHDDLYYIDVIVKDSRMKVTYKRVVLNINQVCRLLHAEKKEPDYIVYEESQLISSASA